MEHQLIDNKGKKPETSALMCHSRASARRGLTTNFSVHGTAQIVSRKINFVSLLQNVFSMFIREFSPGRANGTRIGNEVEL